MPSLFTQDLADRICARLAEGESLRKACGGGPDPSTVLRWTEQRPEFAQQYAQARARGYEMHADGLLELSDTPQLGVIVTTKPDGGEETKLADMIEHRRLQIDTRKWLLSKMLPKKYGDKLDLNGNLNMSVTWPVLPPAIER